MNIKRAVLSMDVEDWYHLNYYLGKADKSYSMLDGFSNYIELLNRHNIKTTFFILSELADISKEQIMYASSCGHEIACHGKTHVRPLDLSPQEFAHQISEAKAKLEDIVGKEVIGYRAPCFGIDNERYKIVKNVGFKYSSSKMDVTGHPLYGELDLNDFEQPVKGIYIKDGMTEFALSTQKLCMKNVAVSGGGWIRLFPWNFMMKPLMKKYLSNAESYVLYIHPFELSKKPMPKVPDIGALTNIRARRNLGKVEDKIEQLIEILKLYDFKFMPFSSIVNEMSSNISMPNIKEYE